MKATFLVLGVLTLLVAAVLGFVWVRGHSYELKDVGYSEASKEGAIRLFIPPEAREITAWIVPNRMNIVASFRIRENDFVAWARTKQWDLTEVEDARIENISRVGDPNGFEEIREGLVHRWTYDGHDPGTTLRIYAYDRAEEMGYFSQLGD